MLTESFVAAASAPPQITSSNSALLTDAGIFVHSFQPQSALRSTFKRSITAANCVAVSSSHAYAAQSGRAVVHVYNREKGNHEVTVAFPERIHSILLACDDSVLVLGTASGCIVLWEICTGRLISTPTLHLQAVNVLAIDPRSNFILTGSLDTNILVWSVLDLLSFPSTSEVDMEESVQSLYTLAAHSRAITAIVLGNGATPSNIAISASEDQTIIIWDYQSGEALRTFLLPSTPLCLTLDPAYRCFYTGYKDGSIHLVPFRDLNPTARVRDFSHASTPIQPPPSTRHFPTPTGSGSAPDGESDSTLSISLSYDSTNFVTGHASGKINSWSIAGSVCRVSMLTQHTGSPITFIKFQPPEGWPEGLVPPIIPTKIVKPRLHESFSGFRGQFNASYTFSAQFASTANNPHEHGVRTTGATAFKEALASPLFLSDMLADGVSELSASGSVAGSVESSGGMDGAGEADDEQDVISLGSLDYSDTEQSEIGARMDHMEEQISHLQDVQRKNERHTTDLTNEITELRRREAEAKVRRAEKTHAIIRGNGENGISDLGDGGEPMDVSRGGYDATDSRISGGLDADFDSGAEGLSSLTTASDGADEMIH